MQIKTLHTLRRVCATLLLLSLACALSSGVLAQPDFTFIQVSDLHYPKPATDATLADLANMRDIVLAPYRITALPPSFIIETGDLTEFGPKDGAWETHNKAIKALNLPTYPALGNHDMTWRTLSREISMAQGRDYYSWNNYGCHFVVLRSAGIQDPRPMLEPQELEWLKCDLAKIGPDTPVFVAFHHPLDISEYSSRYEIDRLVEILRPYNIAAIMVGHSHTILHKTFEGLDMIRGGSTFGPCVPGCTIYSVLGDTLRVAYKVKGHAQATIPLLQKPLHPRNKTAFPFEIVSPQKNECRTGELVISVRATCKPTNIQTMEANIDGGSRIDLFSNADGTFSGKISLADLVAGVHYVRVGATLGNGSVLSESNCFRIPSDKPKVGWVAQMCAASKSTPAVSDKAVYVGANDGYVRAYDRKSGALLWRFATGGAVTGEPLLIGGRLYFGSEDTYLYCISADRGYLVWKYPACTPIYSSCVTDGKAIYFGCCSGAFYSLNATTGSLNWANNDATYTIESKPFLAAGRVYYGAWDNYVYCVDTTNGKLVWKCMGQGSAEGSAPPYYSPADCGPVVLSTSKDDGKVFVADRKYRLSIIDIKTGKIDKFLNGVSAVALSSNGRSVYARKLNGRLDKLDQAGSFIWSTDCGMDDVAAAPNEVGGVVYVSSKRGLVSAIGAADGKIRWQYQATPQSYVLSGISAFDGTAFVSGTDGSLTAVGE